VLRVTTLYASSAAATATYYTRYLAGAPGEEPGGWSGRQAAGLGLDGRVDADQLEALLEGRDPTTGLLLGTPLRDRTSSTGMVVRAVAGFDATFSAPKSVSVWWALTGDPGLLAAHDVAVRAALEHLERYGSTTRIRAGGRRLHPDTGGLTMPTFRQTTPRADDPQLHTHSVISAKVHAGDSRWLALDAGYLRTPNSLRLLRRRRQQMMAQAKRRKASWMSSRISHRMRSRRNQCSRAKPCSNDPAIHAQPGIMLLAATGDDRLDPRLANLLAVFVMVVAAIGVERIRTLGAGCPSAGSQAGGQVAQGRGGLIDAGRRRQARGSSRSDRRSWS
jgi:conjugative relaxase-like TrwC/TraI family protein